MSLTIVALICARGGSKGLPGKNIRPLRGKPLISWAIEQAGSVAGISRVLVSTDSPEIASVARSAGAEVPFMRPSDLSRDDSPEWQVWRHAISYLADNEGRAPDALLVVPATAPLRHAADLNRCIHTFVQGDADVVLTVTAAHRSPYFNMVREHADGTVGLVIPQIKSVVRRQDAPPVFDVTTVGYVVRSSFVLSNDSIFSGRVRAVAVPPERAVDIDTLLDFQYAEFLLAADAEREAAP